MSGDGGAKTIQLAHGGGGRMTGELIRRVFAAELGNPLLDMMDDSATFEAGGRLAFTIDCHVVSPPFFPGGDIGRLALTGTVNDLAMAGARPLYISAGFILEEGFPQSDLQTIVASMQAAAVEAGVMVVAGDTKVVERGAADGIFITTSGIGLVPEGTSVSCAAARPGDAVIVSGSIGDHGVAVMSRRQGMTFSTELLSDCAPLGDLVACMFSAASEEIHALRDPTRGGLAAVLNEIASASGVAVDIDDSSIPIKPEVRAACEMLGLDPLSLANEGKLVAFVAAEAAEAVLEAMRAHRYGGDAVIIGRVEKSDRHRVYLRTVTGGRRVLTVPAGENLPRIC